MSLMLSTFDTSQLLMSLLKLELTNISVMFSTLDTSHLLISPLNFESENNQDMSVIRDVSMSFKSQSGPSTSILDLIMSLSSSLFVGLQEYAENFARFFPIFKASFICVVKVFILVFLLACILLLLDTHRTYCICHSLCPASSWRCHC